jgi:hypothetical protein
MPIPAAAFARTPRGGGATLPPASDREQPSVELLPIALSRLDSRRLAHLPRSIGLSVMMAGFFTGLLPPLPGPEDVLIVAFGALALWRDGFRACERWSYRSFPRAHRAGTSVILRYLDDLERRYPGTVTADTFATHPLDSATAADGNFQSVRYPPPVPSLMSAAVSVPSLGT